MYPGTTKTVCMFWAGLTYDKLPQHFQMSDAVCSVHCDTQIHCKEKKRNFIGLPPTNFKNKNVFGFNDTTFELDVGRNIDVDVVSGCSIRSTFDVKMAILRFRWNH